MNILNSLRNQMTPCNRRDNLNSKIKLQVYTAISPCHWITKRIHFFILLELLMGKLEDQIIRLRDREATNEICYPRQQASILHSIKMFLLSRKMIE